MADLEAALFYGEATAAQAAKRSAILATISDADRADRTSLQSKLNTAFPTLLKATANSYQFFKAFKSSHTSTYINELYSISDWHAITDSASHTAARSSSNATGTTAVLAAARSYYAFLYSEKESRRDQGCLDDYLQTLRDRPVDAALSDAAEAPFTLEDVTKAVRSLKPNKACGPDCLPPELYHYHSTTLAPILLRVFNEIHSAGTLTDTMRMGEITLLYKKKAREDIRNYRPITLLNSDYKILSAIITKRIVNVVIDYITPWQTGFVPERLITDNTQLLYLLQSVIEDRYESGDHEAGGAFVMLDQEKAFDSVSWDTIRKTFRAMGFGPHMCAWVDVLCNSSAPVTRTLRINGEYLKSSTFAQGSRKGTSGPRYVLHASWNPLRA
jgi:hypothetical protein